MSPPVERIAGDDVLPAAADVVVIGGGIIGVSAAYRLAQRGVSVALLEKGHVACEQSSRNWGWCKLQGRALPEVPLALLSTRLWAGLDAEIGAATGFRQAGITLLTRDPAEIAYWEAWTEQAKDYQIPGRILDAAEVRAAFPDTVIPWSAGWHSPQCGRAEPSRAVPAMAAAARRLGVTVMQGCAARGMETTGGRVSAVVTEKGVIRTGAVLCAGGAWASMFCRRHGIRLPQAGVFATAFATGAAPAVTEGALGSDGFSLRRRDDGGYTVAWRGRVRVELTPQGMLYARDFMPMLRKQWAHTRLGIGRFFLEGPQGLARWSFDRVSPFERIRVLDPAPDMAVADDTLTRLQEAFPVLRAARMRQAWGGLIDATPDAIPVISAVDRLPGFHLATGFSGHGFALGPGAGQLAAEIVTGATPSVDPTPYRYSRLVDRSRLRPTTWV